MKLYIAVVLLICIVLISGCSSQKITNFEECVNAGNPVMESYPRQCKADGNTFVEKIDIVVCTQDAKECPDGSFVARVAPDCKFAPCPGE
jgi:hypothetical protein